MSSNISHGRGGAANIKPDDTPYADGEIIREGNPHDQHPHSAGRGGIANIKAANKLHQTNNNSHSSSMGKSSNSGGQDVVPETATRIEKNQSHHLGRGGAGNESHVHTNKSEQHGVDGVADKVKGLFHKK